MDFKLHESCHCPLCTGYMTRRHARIGSMTEIIQSILSDNRLGGLYHNSQKCKNCCRMFYAGTGRWTKSGSQRGWVDELPKAPQQINGGAGGRSPPNTGNVKKFHSNLPRVPRGVPRLLPRDPKVPWGPGPRAPKAPVPMRPWSHGPQVPWPQGSPL